MQGQRTMHSAKQDNWMNKTQGVREMLTWTGDGKCYEILCRTRHLRPTKILRWVKIKGDNDLWRRWSMALRLSIEWCPDRHCSWQLVHWPNSSNLSETSPARRFASSHLYHADEQDLTQTAEKEWKSVTTDGGDHEWDEAEVLVGVLHWND